MFKKGIAAVAAAAAVLLLASCSLLSSDAPRDENGQVTEATTISVFKLQKGDCFDEASMGTGEVNTVKVIPCDEPHDSEIFAEKTLTGSSYPGDSVIQDDADEFCYSEFEPFVGISYESSIHYFYSLTPTQGSWEGENDRLIQCIIISEDGNISESLKGAAS